jgi:ribosomal protein L37AE/L43A
MNTATGIWTCSYCWTFELQCGTMFRKDAATPVVRAPVLQPE